MVEMVFALLLIQDHKIVEHRYKDSLSDCLKSKRYAMKDRSPGDRVVLNASSQRVNIHWGKENNLFDIRMKWIIPLLLLSTSVLADTATTGNLLPNAGTGQTSPQHSNSTIDGINSSTGFTLNNVTDYSSNFNELEANGNGTVSASGTLLDISAGDHTTTEDSLDGGVTLTSKTEVQNCEWVGSAYQCGQATSGQDSYSTTVTILDENDNELATVTQNRNKDSGYNNNTHTYTDTVTHTGEGQESGVGNGKV